MGIPKKMLTKVIKNCSRSLINTRTFSKFAKFDYKDGLNFRSLLTDEELMIEDTAEKFSQSYLMPQIQQANREGSFDINIYKEMGKLGLIGCSLEDYGG